MLKGSKDNFPELNEVAGVLKLFLGFPLPSPSPKERGFTPFPQGEGPGDGGGLNPVAIKLNPNAWPI